MGELGGLQMSERIKTIGGIDYIRDDVAKDYWMRATKAEAERDELLEENEELKDQIKLLNELLGKTLAYTPKSFHTPILEVLNKKDKSKYEN